MKEWSLELWDKVDKVDEKFGDQIAKNDRLGRFLREKASINQEYAKMLKKLVSRYEKGKDDLTFSSDRAFSSLLKETNNIGNQYEQISEEIIKNCVQPFTIFTGELIGTRKELRQDYSKLLKILDDCGKDVDRSKDNWISKYKNSDKAKQNYEKADQDQHVTKADVEKARQNREQKRSLAEDAKNEYAQKLVRCNEQQRSHHTQHIPTILNNYQTQYLKSSDEFTKVLKNYCHAEEKFRPLVKSCLDDIASHAEQIDKENDSELIVDNYKTGYHPPDDLPFEDIEHDSKTSTTGQRITRLGGFFIRNKKTEKSPQEDMSHLPPEQRRRALKKLKLDMEKQLEKENKELKALEKMHALALSNSKMGNPESFNPQIDACTARLDEHERKLKQINVWLGVASDSSQNYGNENKWKDSAPPPPTRTIFANNKNEIPDPPPPSSSLFSNAKKPLTMPLPPKEITGDEPNYSIPIRVKTRQDSFDDDSEGYATEAECLYEFAEDGDGCIQIFPGLRLIVTESDTGDGWTKVKKAGTTNEGFVPTSYIKIL